MTSEPTSTTTAPLRNASRKSSPQSMPVRSCATPASFAGGAAYQRASSTPTTIAGLSISAIAATM